MYQAKAFSVHTTQEGSVIEIMVSLSTALKPVSVRGKAKV
jgi:hypothetical protein